MWDLWWTKWHWGRFFSEFFGFPLPISFHHCSIFICHHPMRCAIAPTKQHIITTSVLSYGLHFSPGTLAGNRIRKKESQDFHLTCLFGLVTVKKRKWLLSLCRGADDRAAYVNLLKELRVAFEGEAKSSELPRLLLTAAVPASFEAIAAG
jgi:hypothetical protein